LIKGKKIAFIGAGNMGRALISGLLTASLVEPGDIVASDPDDASLGQLKTEHGIETTRDNASAASHSEVIVLAVKPQVMEPVLQGISSVIDDSKLVLSIAAGITIDFIRSRLGKGPRIIRVMPNTPALVREGAAAIAPDSSATEEDVKLTVDFFSAVGRALVVEEKMMDAVTGLSGSGPAYAFIFIEALSDGGVKMGLPRDVSLQLSAQTVLGAARMVIELGKNPGELKDRVTSPAGTTIEGVQTLESGALRGTVMKAVEAATLRSRELGKA
jgi:pyrroline-5-carboxylate reductase